MAISSNPQQILYAHIISSTTVHNSAAVLVLCQSLGSSSSQVPIQTRPPTQLPTPCPLQVNLTHLRDKWEIVPIVGLHPPTKHHHTFKTLEVLRSPIQLSYYEWKGKSKHSKESVCRIFLKAASKSAC